MARRGAPPRRRAAAAAAFGLALLSLAARRAHAGAGDAAELAALQAMQDKPNTRFPAEPGGAWTTKQVAPPHSGDSGDAPHSSTPQQRLEIAILTLKSAFVEPDVRSNDAVCNPDDAPDPCLCARTQKRSHSPCRVVCACGWGRCTRAHVKRRRRRRARANGVVQQRAAVRRTRPLGAAPCRRSVAFGRSFFAPDLRACVRALARLLRRRHDHGRLRKHGPAYQLCAARRSAPPRAAPPPAGDAHRTVCRAVPPDPPVRCRCRRAPTPPAAASTDLRLHYCEVVAKNRPEALAILALFLWMARTRAHAHPRTSAQLHPNPQPRVRTRVPRLTLAPRARRCWCSRRSACPLTCSSRRR
jgi:hypothetical protein